jgi:hypothetical protein
MDDDALADANKAEAAPIESLTLLAYVLVRLPFLRNFHSDEVEKWEARNSVQNPPTGSLACPPWMVLRNKSKIGQFRC